MAIIQRLVLLAFLISLLHFERTLSKGGVGRGGGSSRGGWSGGSKSSSGRSWGKGSSKSGGGFFRKSSTSTKSIVRPYNPKSYSGGFRSPSFGRFAKGAAVGYLIGSIHRPYYYAPHGYNYNRNWLDDDKICKYTASSSELESNTTIPASPTVQLYFECDYDEYCCGSNCCYDQSITRNTLSTGAIVLIIFIVLGVVGACGCIFLKMKSSSKRSGPSRQGVAVPMEESDTGPGAYSTPYTAYPPASGSFAYSGGPVQAPTGAPYPPSTTKPPPYADLPPPPYNMPPTNDGIPVGWKV